MELSGKTLPVSGKPIEWAIYLSDGEFDCDYCKDDNTDACDECCDYGTLFIPKDNI